MNKLYKMMGSLLMVGGIALGMTATGEAAVETQAQNRSTVTAAAVGGWTVTEGSTKIDRHTRKVFFQAVDGLVGCDYEPVALLGKQVAAGTHYCLLSRLTPVVPDAKAHWGLVYVYEDLQGQAKLIGVEDMELGQMKRLVENGVS